jgi:uncharacterized membrane protein
MHHDEGGWMGGWAGGGMWLWTAIGVLVVVLLVLVIVKLSKKWSCAHASLLNELNRRRNDK